MNPDNNEPKTFYSDKDEAHFSYREVYNEDWWHHAWWTRNSAVESDLLQEISEKDIERSSLKLRIRQLEQELKQQTAELNVFKHKAQGCVICMHRQTVNESVSVCKLHSMKSCKELGGTCGRLVEWFPKG